MQMTFAAQVGCRLFDHRADSACVCVVADHNAVCNLILRSCYW